MIQLANAISAVDGTKSVKVKVKPAFENEVDEKRKTSMKMRFIQKKRAETYLRSGSKCPTGFMTTLEKVEEMDTTAHVCQFKSTNNKNHVTVKNLEEGEQMKDNVELCKLAEGEQEKLDAGLN